MSAFINNFDPITNGAQQISVTNASSATLIAKPSRDLRIWNSGSKPCWIALVTTSTSTTSVGAGFYLLNGTGVVLKMWQNAAYLAAICTGSDTTTLEVAPGQGS